MKPQKSKKKKIKKKKGKKEKNKHKKSDRSLDGMGDFFNTRFTSTYTSCLRNLQLKSAPNNNIFHSRHSTFIVLLKDIVFSHLIIS